jgi:putative membrane protein
LLQINYGTIETHQTFLPFYKIQHVSLTKTIFQERKNVSDVVFQTASGKLKIPCLKDSEALKILNFALYKIETSQQSWM